MHRGIEELLPWHVAAQLQPAWCDAASKAETDIAETNTYSLPHGEALLDHGQMTLGVLHPVGCVEAVNDEHTCLDML